MKDMNKAERMIWKAAQGVVSTERIEEIKKMAARKTH